MFFAQRIALQLGLDAAFYLAANYVFPVKDKQPAQNQNESVLKKVASVNKSGNSIIGEQVKRK